MSRTLYVKNRRNNAQRQLDLEYKERKPFIAEPVSPLAKRIAHFMQQSLYIQSMKRSSPSKGHNIKSSVVPHNGPCTMETIEKQIAQQNQVIQELELELS